MRRSARSTRRACVWAGGVTAAALLLPVLSGQSYFGQDLSWNDLGFVCEFRRLLSQGQGLSLSPLLGNGEPFLGNPLAQVLYPFRWVSLLFPGQHALDFQVVFHVAMAAVGATWLARSWRLRPGFAVGCGLLCAFSGTTLDLVRHSHYLVGGAWLPWAWAAARRLLDARGAGPLRGAFLLWLAALALMLAGAEPQAYGVALFVAGLEAGSRPVRARRIWGLALGAAAAFLLAWPTWGPALAEMRLGGRTTQGLALAEVTRWSFDGLQSLGVFLPGVLREGSGLPSLSLIWESEGRVPVWNSSPYLGLAAVLLALGGIVARRRGRRVLGLALGVMLVWALGSATPVFPALVRWVPGLGAFRYPAKAFLLPNLVLVLGAAMGAERAFRDRAFLKSLVAPAVLAGAWCAWAIVRLQLGPGYWQAPALLGTALLAGLGPRSWRRLVMVLLVLDVALTGFWGLEWGPPIDPVGSVLAEARQEVLRENIPNLCFPDRFNGFTFRQGEVSPSYAQLLFKKVHGGPQLNACDGFSNPLHYTVFENPLNLGLDRALDRGSAAAALALGCTHRLQLTPGPSPRLEVQTVAEPVGAAFFQPAPELQNRTAGILAAVERARSADEVTRILDDPEGRLKADRFLEATPGVVRGPAQVHWLGPAHAEVDAGGSGSGLVGLRTSYFRGWKAFQGGQPLPVVRVAGNLLGAWTQDAALGPVRFVYQPPRSGQAWPAVVGGIFLAALGLALFKLRPFRL